MSENTNKSDNMVLWNQVCQTDPKHTKKVSYGSRKFTDVDAQWLRQRATELWGPYGTHWGLKGVEYQVLPVQLGDGIVHSLLMRATFWYPPSGEFEIVNDMKFDPQGECMKKLHTNTLSKALSFLGFSADVYLGQFDDSRYVAEMDKHFRSEERAKNGTAKQPPKSNGAPPKADEKPKRTWKDAVAEIIDAKSAEATATKLHEHFAGHADPHDTILRNVLAKIGQLVGEKKIEESQGDAMSAIIREWIITPTEYETLNKEAAGVF